MEVEPTFGQFAAAGSNVRGASFDTGALPAAVFLEHRDDRDMQGATLTALSSNWATFAPFSCILSFGHSMFGADTALHCEYNVDVVEQGRWRTRTHTSGWLTW